MREVHGKLLMSGIPRTTRPRKDKNTGVTGGFTVIDPGGNWIRIFRLTPETPPAPQPQGVAVPWHAPWTTPSSSPTPKVTTAKLPKSSTAR